MKESVRERVVSGEFKIKELLLEAGRQALSLLAGFLMSRGVVFGEIMPFGIAFAASVPTE